MLCRIAFKGADYPYIAPFARAEEGLVVEKKGKKIKFNPNQPTQQAEHEAKWVKGSEVKS